MCIRDRGNANGHLILRGGKQTNYDPQSVAECERIMQQAGLRPTLMVDCSHANSGKDFRRQPEVAEVVIQQRLAGNKSIIGLMLESHLNEGKQDADLPFSQLKYGVSITDGCINWVSTETLLRNAHHKLSSCLTQSG